MIKLSGRVAWESLTKAITEIQRTRSDSSHRDHYEVWFGTYAESRGHTVQHNLGQMMDKFSFWGFTFDCDCNEEFPSELRKYTLQLWDCRSVTDKSLDQSPAAEKSGSVSPSGASRKMSKRLNFSAWPASSFGPSKFVQPVYTLRMSRLRRTHFLLPRIWIVTWHSFWTRITPPVPPPPSVPLLPVQLLPPPPLLPPMPMLLLPTTLILPTTPHRPIVSNGKGCAVSDFCRLPTWRA